MLRGSIPLTWFYCRSNPPARNIFDSIITHSNFFFNIYATFIINISMKKKDRFEIVGGNQLFGVVRNQASKNASLPIMSASLLSDGQVVLHNLPNISDVQNMVKILKQIGVHINIHNDEMHINPNNATSKAIDCKLCKTMRSSVFLLGSMLQRFKIVDLPLPGGCDIGKRPIDIHINAFKKLGVNITNFDDHVLFEAKNVHADTIKLKIPSVGATENIIQFACKLKGTTTILNPAKEPEVIDLCTFLNQMGAKIMGAGTDKITIYGVDKLDGAAFRPMGDRIVAGTIAGAVAMVGGDVTITNAVPYQNEKFLKILRSMGCQIDIKDDIIHIIKTEPLKAIKKIKTGYYPDFPTDLQSIVLAISTLANGTTDIEERVFENRFLTVSEMKKFGANITKISNKKVKVQGTNKLVGAKVKAKDLRGGASLVLMSLASTGTTIVNNVHFIDRGYENLENIFEGLGANIRRIWQRKA